MDRPNELKYVSRAMRYELGYIGKVRNESVWDWQYDYYYWHHGNFCIGGDKVVTLMTQDSFVYGYSDPITINVYDIFSKTYRSESCTLNTSFFKNYLEPNTGIHNIVASWREATTVYKSGTFYAYMCVNFSYWSDDNPEGQDKNYEKQFMFRFTLDIENLKVVEGSQVLLNMPFEIDEYTLFSQQENVPRLTADDSGNVYYADFIYANENTEIYISSDGINFSVLFEVPNSAFIDAGHRSEPENNHGGYGVWWFKGELYTWWNFSYGYSYSLELYCIKSPTEVEFTSNVLEKTIEGYEGYSWAHGPDRVIYTEHNNSHQLNESIKDSVWAELDAWEDGGALLFEPTAAPYIEGFIDYTNHDIQKEDVDDYRKGGNYVYSFDNSSSIYGINNLHEPIYLESDGYYRIYIPQSEQIDSPKLMIGFVGAKPFFENSNLYLSFGFATNKNYTLEQVSREIYTAEDLFNIRYLPYGDFELKNNIELKDFSVPSYHPKAAGYEEGFFDFEEVMNKNLGYFPPINFYSCNYSVIYINFNGNNYKIKNFTYIDEEESWDDYGLFAAIYKEDEEEYEEKLIKNLKVENAYIEVVGNYSCAIIVGEVLKTSIINCQASGTVINEEGNACGITCFSFDSTGNAMIEECSFNGNLTGGRYYTSGIVGYCEGNIINCYAIGDFNNVYTYSDTAGIAGEMYGNKIENCYFVGTITGAGAKGIITASGGQPQIISCYYDNEILDTENIGYINGEGRKTKEMTLAVENFDYNKFRTENDNFDFNLGTYKNTIAVIDTLQLSKVVPSFDLCSFIVSRDITDDWFSQIKIEKNGSSILNAQYNTYAETGYRDNTSTVLEVNAGDVLDITIGMGGYYAQYASIGANFNGTLEKIMDIARITGGETHTFQWTVPANQGIFVLSFQEAYSGYISPCDGADYGERQDFTIAIDEEVGFYPAGYRKSTPLYLEDMNEIYSSLIEWNANDNGQTVIIETSVDEGQSWQLAQNVHPIPNLTIDSPSVRVKQTLVTDDITVTPALNSIYYEVNANINPRDTYIGWNFESTWNQDIKENDGYPVLYSLAWGVIINSDAKLNILEELSGIEGRSDTWANLSKTSIGFALPWEILCNFGFDISREYPIVRTDRAKRSEDGGQMDAGGTVIDIGPYAQELEEGKVKGFVQYRPDYMPDFGDFRAYQTDYVLLPQYKPNLPLTELVDDISSSQTSFDVVDGTQIPAGPGNLVIKESNDKFEIISYDSVTGNTVEGVIRGGFETRARNFYAGTILMEYKFLEETLTWINNAWPLDPQRPYSYRAAIEIDTENNEGYQTFKFYGDAQMVEGNTKIDFSGLDRAERFIDGRDLDTLDELIDRGKFKIGEEIWEGWNDEEFKNWVWEEISDWDNNFQLGSLTEKELKSLVINLSSYTLDDLEGLTISELEELLKDILDTISEAQIDSLYKNADTYLSSYIDENQVNIGVEDSSKLLAPPARAVIKITEDHREIIEYESVSSNDLTDVLRGDPSFSFPAGTGVWKYGTDYNYLDELLRFLMPQPKGAFSDWTEEELKNFIKFLLLNDYDWSFEVDFPFYKWEDDIKAVLNINIKDNTSIELEYNEEGPYKYMKDFNLGDVIVAEYEGEFRALVRIIEVKEEESAGGKRYTLTLGRNFENLLSKINKNGDGVSRRL